MLISPILKLICLSRYQSTEFKMEYNLSSKLSAGRLASSVTLLMGGWLWDGITHKNGGWGMICWHFSNRCSVSCHLIPLLMTSYLRLLVERSKCHPWRFPWREGCGFKPRPQQNPDGKLEVRKTQGFEVPAQCRNMDWIGHQSSRLSRS